MSGKRSRLRHAGAAAVADTVRDRAKFNTTTSAIAGVVENLRSQLQVLERDIKADKKGKQDYEDQLGKLQREREECRARLAANREWAAKFDEEIGPFERKYETLTGNISGLYENAKAEHRKGLDLLIQEFAYNPLFKLPHRQFHAIPFVPK